MERVPEPELMEDTEQVAAYATADFSEPNQLFRDYFVQCFPEFSGTRMVDLGCGPADIPIRMINTYPNAEIIAVDGSAAMLAWARGAAERANHASRISLVHWRIGELPVPNALSVPADAVISNSLLHHLFDPFVLWRTIRVCGAPAAAVLIMDLRRPDTEGDAVRIVEQYAADESPLLKRDFFNSLLAAYREDEIVVQLQTARLGGLRVARISDRHLAVHGRLY